MTPVRLGGLILTIALLGCQDGTLRSLGGACSAFDTRLDVGGAGVAEGVAIYHKQVISLQGPTGTVVSTPIQYADTEVVSCETGAVLASGTTDATGRFQLAFVNPGRVGVYVRVLTSVSRFGLTVKRSSAEPFVYGLSSSVFDDTGDNETTMVAGLTASSPLGAGAFNILSQGVRGAELLEAVTGSPPGVPLVWYWYPGSPDGTSYQPVTKSISVLGTAADPDEFDDAVLLHEYGHYVLDVYSRDDSPGGPHVLGDSSLDLRLAWSEGWATFFSSVVRNDPVHVDSSGSGLRLAFEIEGPSLGAATRYDSNELAVAAVLWDAYDTDDSDEGSGTLSGLLSAIWSVTVGLNTAPVSFEDFWIGWQAADPGDLQPILAARSIDLWPDAQEAGGNDDDPSRAKPITLFTGNPAAILHHSFYPAGDVDYVEFVAPVAGTYTVATSRCAGFPVVCDARVSNGADTVLSVLSLADNGPAADNLNGRTYSSSCALTTCPPNDARTLSSSVTFSATTNESFIIEIRRSPFAPPSAGELGTYDLVVTSG